MLAKIVILVLLAELILTIHEISFTRSQIPMTNDFAVIKYKV